MEDFEKIALSSAPKGPTIWFRYAGDTSVIWFDGENELAAQTLEQHSLPHPLQNGEIN